jgi:hypothetical protein
MISEKQRLNRKSCCWSWSLGVLGSEGLGVWGSVNQHQDFPTLTISINY